MALRLVTAPAALPLTLPMAWRHLRLDPSGSPEATDHDAELLEKIAAVTVEADGRDGWLGRALIRQRWAAIYDCFPAAEITLPLAPVPAEGSPSHVVVTYVDDTGAAQTLSTSLYLVDTDAIPARIRIAPDQSWPSTRGGLREAVTVTFDAGYGTTADDVPAAIRSALLLRLEADFDRGADRELLMKRSEQLLAPHRVMWF